MSSPAITPSTVDMCTLGEVKDWLGIAYSNTDDDSMIQFLITSFSQYVINATGVESFNSVQNYVETYDGNGASRMFLDNRPIVNVTSVVIGAYSVPQSTNTTSSGFFIERSKKSIAFRSSGQALMPPLSIYPYQFTPGIGNVTVTYSAGYTRCPYDLQEACFKAVALNYRRKEWIGVHQKSLSAGAGVSGTITYTGWALPPEINAVLDIYSRYARP